MLLIDLLLMLMLPLVLQPQHRLLPLRLQSLQMSDGDRICRQSRVSSLLRLLPPL